MLTGPWHNQVQWRAHSPALDVRTLSDSLLSEQRGVEESAGCWGVPNRISKPSFYSSLDQRLGFGSLSIRNVHKIECFPDTQRIVQPFSRNMAVPLVVNSIPIHLQMWALNRMVPQHHPVWCGVFWERVRDFSFMFLRLRAAHWNEWTALHAMHRNMHETRPCLVAFVGVNQD